MTARWWNWCIRARFAEVALTSQILYDDRKICSLPTLFLQPIEGEDDLPSQGQLIGGQVGYARAQSGIIGLDIVRGLPAIKAPMHHCRSVEHKPQVLTRFHGSTLVVEAPSPIGRFPFLDLVAMHWLRRLVEDFAVAKRTPQLDVFRVRPHQGTSGARAFAGKQFLLRQIRSIPNLFRQ